MRLTKTLNNAKKGEKPKNEIDNEETSMNEIARCDLLRRIITPHLEDLSCRRDDKFISSSGCMYITSQRNLVSLDRRQIHRDLHRMQQTGIRLLTPCVAVSVLV